MKALLLLLLLLVSLSLSSAVNAGDSPAPVHDVKGDPLKVGSNYFVIPVNAGHGGGLYPSNVRQHNTVCPLDVIQEATDDKGIPVVLTPSTTSKNGVVRLSTDLNVRFFTPTICARNMTWKLDAYDEPSQQYFVRTGGAIGNPGPETLSSWFKIEKFKDDYKFVFCPSVCAYCKVICRDVGIFQKDGVNFLALATDVPFNVKFEKTF